MDYIVQDSSIFKDDDAFELYDNSDDSIRLGIVRKSVEVEGVGTKYLVEVFLEGKQVPVSCIAMTRFNSPYNFEEIRYKNWLRGPAASGLLAPGAASTYNLRDGETVVVAFLDGQSREGIILGAVPHPSRATATEADTLAYHSVYNGLETTIDVEGAYTVTFQGTPTNDLVPIPPGTKEIAEVQYDPTKAGSFYGFDSTGSFTIDASNEASTNSIVITKDPAGGTMTITSGKNVISIAGTPALGELSVTTDTLSAEVLDLAIKASKSVKMEAAASMSLKGTKVAIGNDTIELIDGLIQVIEGLGQVTVTSPVGTCTPIMASPQWATIAPLIISLKTLKGSL